MTGRLSLVLTSLLLVLQSQAQEVADFASSPPDSLSVPPDSLSLAAADSVVAPAGLDTVVVYQSADSIWFSFGTKTMDMYGPSTLTYGSVNLEANRINIDWTTSMLTADGAPDSSGATAGYPEFTDSGEEYRGTRVYYHFKTKKGRVLTGKTEMGDGFYRGDQIKKVTPGVLFVADGIYTTCDRDEPHFHFWGEEMKLLIRDKIIARPVVLKVNEVPVFALPFAILPNRTGRQSGIIPPAYGESAIRGIFLRGGGYYWALSDYTDLALTGDLYSKGGYNLYSDFSYNKRYDFYGSLQAGYTKDIAGETSDPDYSESDGYKLYWNHHQQFNPYQQLDANVNFSSDNYLRRTSFKPDELVTQEIISNANYSHKFEDSPWSANVGFSRNQNIITKEYYQTFPTVQIYRQSTTPFRDPDKPASQQSWYERITLGYNGFFTNRNQKVFNRTDSTYQSTMDNGIRHSPSINIPFSLGPYVTINPSFSYAEYWYFRTIEKKLDPTTNQFSNEKKEGFASARTFSTGVSASTRLYGIIQPQFGSVTGFRHVLQPTMGFTYTPDFSDPYWGYYKTVSDTAGRQLTYSQFEGSIIGGPGRGKTQSLAFGLGNTFEMKLKGKPDENGKAGKDEVIQLIGI